MKDLKMALLLAVFCGISYLSYAGNDPQGNRGPASVSAQVPNHCLGGLKI